MSRLYTAEEIALFVGSCGDLSSENQSEIKQAVEDWEEHMQTGGFTVGRQVPDKKTPIIGRERALLDGLSNGLQGVVGGPPPSKATMAQVRRHNSSRVYKTERGNSFEVQIVGPEGEITGHIARVTVELDRFEEVVGK